MKRFQKNTLSGNRDTHRKPWFPLQKLGISDQNDKNVVPNGDYTHAILYRTKIRYLRLLEMINSHMKKTPFGENLGQEHNEGSKCVRVLTFICSMINLWFARQPLHVIALGLNSERIRAK